MASSMNGKSKKITRSLYLPREYAISKHPLPPPRGGIPLNPYPRWLRLILESKLPVGLLPRDDFTMTIGRLSCKLDQVRPEQEFDLSDPYLRYRPAPEYKSLHDPHCRKYFRKPGVHRHLHKNGYITAADRVISKSLPEFNQYRRYLYRLYTNEIRQYRKREQENLQYRRAVHECRRIEEHWRSEDYATIQKRRSKCVDLCRFLRDLDEEERKRYLKYYAADIERKAEWKLDQLKNAVQCSRLVGIERHLTEFREIKERICRRKQLVLREWMQRLNEYKMTEEDLRRIEAIENSEKNLGRFVKIGVYKDDALFMKDTTKKMDDLQVVKEARAQRKKRIDIRRKNTYAEYLKYNNIDLSLHRSQMRKRLKSKRSESVIVDKEAPGAFLKDGALIDFVLAPGTYYVPRKSEEVSQVSEGEEQVTYDQMSVEVAPEEAIIEEKVLVEEVQEEVTQEEVSYVEKLEEESLAEKQELFEEEESLMEKLEQQVLTEEESIAEKQEEVLTQEEESLTEKQEEEFTQEEASLAVKQEEELTLEEESLAERQEEEVAQEEEFPAETQEEDMSQEKEYLTEKQEEPTEEEISIAEMKGEMTPEDLSIAEMQEEDVIQEEISITEMQEEEIVQEEISLKEEAQQVDLAQEEVSITEMQEEEITQEEMSLAEVQEEEITQEEISQLETQEEELTHEEISISEKQEEEATQEEISLSDKQLEEMAQEEASLLEKLEEMTEEDVSLGETHELTNEEYSFEEEDHALDEREQTAETTDVQELDEKEIKVPGVISIEGRKEKSFADLDIQKSVEPQTTDLGETEVTKIEFPALESIEAPDVEIQTVEVSHKESLYEEKPAETSDVVEILSEEPIKSSDITRSKVSEIDFSETLNAQDEVLYGELTDVPKEQLLQTSAAEAAETLQVDVVKDVERTAPAKEDEIEASEDIQSGTMDSESFDAVKIEMSYQETLKTEQVETSDVDSSEAPVVEAVETFDKELKESLDIQTTEGIEQLSEANESFEQLTEQDISDISTLDLAQEESKSAETELEKED